MSMVVSCSGTTSARGYENYVQICADEPLETPHRACLAATPVQPSEHSYDLSIGVDNAIERLLFVALPYGRGRACGTWRGKWSAPAARPSLSHKTYVELS